ncbi:thermonuclease family protein [Psychromonas ossibalaenae]|uniref:thermonuclease family protein n=1 Tax=Psychromonas ossibalaenae TaxID=444922 RepID=UPI000365F6EC|nr:thermonuclease family protein [Psychromonas ossibalaenae]
MFLRFFILFLILPVQLYASCQKIGWDQTVTLKKINDGDTVTLTNGSLVRLIGINTPEINHRDKSLSEPFAFEAKRLLEKYIKAGDKLHLVFDKTKQDKYGRILAYVYSKTGRNLALLQLQNGLAKQLVIGKNDRFWRCFQKAERRARLRKKGIWSEFKPLSAAALNKTDKGYVYIKGTVTELHEDKKGLSFKLDRKLEIKIAAKPLKMFKDNNVDFLLHDKLLLTGKLTFSRQLPRLRLYHPAQILP